MQTHTLTKAPTPETKKKSGTTPFFQAKLTVNTPGDTHEREADQVADQVMRMKEEEEPKVQRKSLTPVSSVQRMCADCEEKQEGKVQRQETTSGGASGQTAPPVVSQVLSSGGGRPMDTGTRQFMEQRFGQDFGQVRIHTGGQAAESASAIQAKAYTSGKDIVFGAGEYRPESGEGKRLLAHELVHISQQNSQIVQRTSWGEKWDAFWDAGPIDSYRASELAEEALAAARRKAPSLPGGASGLHNGHADAWRHCYWNCRMKNVIGEEDASEIATNHESHGGNTAVETTMDTWNNEEGRKCSGNCDQCCEDKLYARKLWILYDNNTRVGVSNPYNLTKSPTSTSPTSGQYSKY